MISRDKPNRPKRLTPAGPLVAAVLEKAGFRPADVAVFEVWDRVMGKNAIKARAVGLSQGRLRVEVDTPVRVHELTLRKRELIKKIDAAFGGTSPVCDIIFRPGNPDIPDVK